MIHMLELKGMIWMDSSPALLTGEKQADEALCLPEANSGVRGTYIGDFLCHGFTNSAKLSVLSRPQMTKMCMSNRHLRTRL